MSTIHLHQTTISTPGMSAWGKKRRFEFRPVTSGLPLSTDILKGRWHVSNLHISRHLDMQRTGN